MLFNSFEFMFAFFPLTLLLFYALGRWSRIGALAWLTLASLAFYAWWRPVNVLIIAPAVLVNYLLAHRLQRLASDPAKVWPGRATLLFGILFNVLFLGYFKYVNFFYTALNDAAGTNFVLTQIILPLGISFITFQKIAFLIDVHGGRVDRFTLQEFFLFVLFFPQLIAGPIVHYREMMPQFRQISCRFDVEHVAVGMTLFVMGLFKKVVLADSLAAHVTPIYESAAAGHTIAFFPAWLAAVGFTLQIYFDFSGYSDMALGLARCFGIKLPPNFDSPLKATSIIDFWLRWHMTLTRFLTAYLYNPLVLWLTRRRMAKRLPVLLGRNASWGAFVQLLAAPTLLTMFVSGLWHGAGYLYILWGLLHGVYLTINHAWRLAGPKLWPNKEQLARVMGPVGFVLTFVAVAVAMVLFRSTTVPAAAGLLWGMAGLHGGGIPPELAERVAWLQPLVSTSVSLDAKEFLLSVSWVVVLSAIALLCPNSLQLIARYEPALGIQPSPAQPLHPLRTLAWSPTLPWAIAVAGLAAVTIMRWGGKSEFLYWQF